MILVVVTGRRDGGPAEDGAQSIFESAPGDARLVDADQESPASLLGRLRDASADLVVLRPGAQVVPGWFESLRSAAYADSLTATASAMPVARLAAVDGKESWPVAAPLWGCVYVRRDALEATNLEAEEAGVESALETVLTRPGLAHRLAATPVVVPGASAEELKRRLAQNPPARRAADAADLRDRLLRVLVDARSLSYPLSGTQVNVLCLVRALAARTDLELAMLVPPAVHPSTEPELEKIPRSVERLTEGRTERRADVLHHPHQLLFERELGEVLGVADRLVITQQDLIVTSTPSYFPTHESWARFAALTRLSFVAADHVAFFSEHARTQALDDGVLRPERTSVIPLGTEHLDEYREREDLDERPAGVDSNAPYLLVLGNAYLHKNRVFALRLFARLVRDHRWDGRLVLAGGHPPVGGSVDDERAYLLRHPELRDRVRDVGPVREAEKRWLYRNARLVLYPTLYEGFGLVPFEAAALGTPAVYANRSSIEEFLPPEGALLDGWGVEQVAARLARVLAEESESERIVGALRTAAEPLTWARTADAYADVYRSVLHAPVGASLVAGDHFTIEPREAVAAGRAEERLLKLYRRSAAFRTAADALIEGGRQLRSLRHLPRLRD